jgi:hypothetical protein
MKVWNWCVFRNAKGHAVSDALVRPLVYELSKLRGCPLVMGKSKTLTSLHFDQPGMVLLSMPQVTIDLDGLAITTWADEVSALYAITRDLPVRRFNGGAVYFKLHGLGRVIVMTRPERDALLDALDAVKADSAERVAAYYENARRAREARGLAPLEEPVRRPSSDTGEVWPGGIDASR